MTVIKDEDIDSEGSFGIIKNNCWYKRVVRRGIEPVRLELFCVPQNMFDAARATGYADGPMLCAFLTPTAFSYCEGTMIQCSKKIH